MVGRIAGEGQCRVKLVDMSALGDCQKQGRKFSEGVGEIVGRKLQRSAWQVTEKNGGDDGTRTRGLCRDSIASRGN